MVFASGADNKLLWRLFALQFTCSIKCQLRSRIQSHIFHIPCLSMINLCLSTNKKFAEKNISRTRAHIFKNQRTRTIFILSRLKETAKCNSPKVFVEKPRKCLPAKSLIKSKSRRIISGKTIATINSRENIFL